MEEIVIRPAKAEEWDEAMELAFRVFLKFEAKDYGREGTEAFAAFVTDSVLKKAFESGHYKVYVAVLNEKLIGIIGLRSGNHISLLFVDGEYHYKGIGRRLLDTVVEYLKSDTSFSKITVNAAPYAEKFYYKYGFVKCGEVARKDGILYIPMEKVL
ncbi:MAG: GNAT family N-acetyltransferase [Lachnospiraceae bacterium]|jgi:GNAT superfamily N-acetyltransferase|nr:GNAT family N-acetyltransferase [Lachnospiraceae bacterium]